MTLPALKLISNPPEGLACPGKCAGASKICYNEKWQKLASDLVEDLKTKLEEYKVTGRSVATRE